MIDDSVQTRRNSQKNILLWIRINNKTLSQRSAFSRKMSKVISRKRMSPHAIRAGERMLQKRMHPYRVSPGETADKICAFGEWCFCLLVLPFPCY